ncbi:hypothetical protein HDU96_008390 [Phlyctochytrium bullatum]|nr:hypothetical protein HDU96_008390 [Phlyctochytrium bullatum]
MGGIQCDPGSACEVVLKYVVPAIGSLTAMFLMVAPVPDVLKAAKSGKLGSLNPIPIALITVNCLGWIAYGWLVRDYFVALPNVFGWTVGSFQLFTLFPFLSAQRMKLIQGILLGVSAAVYFISSVSFLSLQDGSGGGAARLVLGVMTNVILIAFYGSPLTTFWEVIKTRNSVSIAPMLAYTSLVNSALWTVYGQVQGDWFITIPNGLGVIFAVTQIFLIYRYPRTPIQHIGEAVEDEEAGGSIPRESASGSEGSLIVGGSHGGKGAAKPEEEELEVGVVGVGMGKLEDSRQALTGKV